MTALFLDPSALVRRYVAGPDRSMVVDGMSAADVWAVSELARTECLLALHRLAATPGTQEALWRSLRDDIAAMHVVPVDARCLGRAVELGATYGLSTVDAIHLAAADRLPRPLTYATFERRQLPAAAALGMEVLAPVEA